MLQHSFGLFFDLSILVPPCSNYRASSIAVRALVYCAEDHGSGPT